MGLAERYRPRFHYTTIGGWINDPIGLVYHENEYHLFNDHNPKSCQFPSGTTTAEQSHWSHGVSKDLVHWEHLPIALHPDTNGACWSGSAVVDWRNTAGFQDGHEPSIVVIYTSAGESFGQSLAYSNDRGRTWHKHKGNPVLSQIADGNRDPQVFWHEATQRWVMILYVKRGAAEVFTSDDLLGWTFASSVLLSGFHECPDLFELPVDGDRANTKWVLCDARFHYWIGEFDGRSFSPTTGPFNGDYGSNFYAAQTWHNTEDRRIQIGWMNGGKYPDMPFNQQMSFPCELTLQTVEGDVRLFRSPVREIETLYTERFHAENKVLIPGENPLPGIRGDLFDIEMNAEPRDCTLLGIRLHDTAITYGLGKVSSLECAAAALQRDGLIKLRVLVDRTSLEIFVNDGEVSMSLCFLPVEESTDLEFFVEGGSAIIRSLRVTKLGSALID
jgi:fructan beta-fructosidase